MQVPQDFTGHFSSDPSQYLFTITQVCRRWRNTAISNSVLWTQIGLQWSPEQCCAWIARSGAIRGLDLFGSHMLEHRYGVTVDSTSFRSVSGALLRWRSISLLRCSQATVARVFARINECEYTCDQLDSVEIKYHSNDLGPPRIYTHSLDQVLWPRLLAKCARQEGENIFPRLQSITVWPGDYSLWGMLSHVTILDLHVPSFISWQDWHPVISQATALETLRLSAHPPIISEFLPVHLDRLLTLDLGLGSHDSFTQCFLHNLSAPALRTLSFVLSWRPLDVEREIAGWLCQFVRFFIPCLADHLPCPEPFLLDFSYTSVN